MSTARNISILSLVLCVATAEATAPTLVGRVTAAPPAPQVTVVGHVSTYLATERDSRRDHLAHALALHVTGSHFVPGSKIGIAVINTLHWEVANRRSTYAQPATTSVICGHDFKTCLQPNPRAGTIDFRVWLNRAPRASNLLVLYRSAREGGMQGVTLR